MVFAGIDYEIQSIFSHECGFNYFYLLLTLRGGKLVRFGDQQNIVSIQFLQPFFQGQIQLGGFSPYINNEYDGDEGIALAQIFF